MSTSVLYIAGSGRSGSTLVDRMLGQLDGVFAAGELRYIWTRAMLDDRLCGCGDAFSRCSTWQAIRKDAFGDAPPDPAGVAAEQRARVRALRVPSLVLRERLRRRRRPEDRRPELAALYGAIVRTSGAQVVVDSSKLPTYALLLAHSGVDLRIAHVVRDPRACAFSWLRHRRLPDVAQARDMQRQGPLKSALLWLLWNAVTEMLWAQRADHYRLVRYEDLVAHPERVLRDLAEFAGIDPESWPFRSEREVDLDVTHSVAGNPSRMRSGVIALDADLEWMSHMRRRYVLLVTALTWPLLLRYGYPLLPGRSTR